MRDRSINGSISSFSQQQNQVYPINYMPDINSSTYNQESLIFFKELKNVFSEKINTFNCKFEDLINNLNQGVLYLMDDRVHQANFLNKTFSQIQQKMKDSVSFFSDICFEKLLFDFDSAVEQLNKTCEAVLHKQTTEQEKHNNCSSFESGTESLECAISQINDLLEVFESDLNLPSLE